MNAAHDGAAHDGDQNEMIRCIQTGDERTFSLLLEEYAPLIDSLTRKFAASGEGDADDFRQEAVIAFYNAAMAFDTEQTEVTFGLFAKICVNNRLISQLRKSKRQHEADEEMLFTRFSSTEEEAVSRKRAEEITKLAATLLTPFELAVFELYAEGAGCRETARKLARNEKAVENALYRIRTKLKRHL